MITLKNLNKSYDNTNGEHSGIFDINLTINNSGLYIIEGESGSGKTTLLNVLGLIDSFDNGSFVIDGKDIQSYSEKEIEQIRKNRISFVFQDYKLFDELSVVENILLSNEYNQDNHDLENILKEVGVYEQKDKKVKLLSGGQKQRVAIARALIKHPSLLIADEPTGNLDTKNSDQIMKIFKDLSTKIPVILVSHNHELSKQYADYSIFMVDGKIVKSTITNNSKECDIGFNQPVPSRKRKFNKNALKILSPKKKYNVILGILLSLCSILASFTIGVATMNQSNIIYKCANDAQEYNSMILPSNNSYNGNKIEETSSSFELERFNVLAKQILVNINGIENYYPLLLSNNINKTNLTLSKGNLPFHENEVIISDYLDDKLSNPNTLEIPYIKCGSYQFVTLSVCGVYKTKFSTPEWSSASSDLQQHYISKYFVQMFSNTTVFTDDYGLNTNCYALLGQESDKNFHVGNYTTWKDDIELQGSLPYDVNEVLLPSNLKDEFLIGHEYQLVDKEIVVNNFQKLNFFTISPSIKVSGFYEINSSDSELNEFDSPILLSEVTYKKCKSISDAFYSKSYYYCEMSKENIKALLNKNFKIETYAFNDISTTFDLVNDFKIISIILSCVILVMIVLLLIKDIMSLYTTKRDSIGTLLCLGFEKKTIKHYIYFSYLLLALCALVASMIFSVPFTILINQIICKGNDALTTFVSYPIFGLLISCIIETAVISIILLFSLTRIKKNNIVWWIKH